MDLKKNWKTFQKYLVPGIINEYLLKKKNVGKYVVLKTGVFEYFFIVLN